MFILNFWQRRFPSLGIHPRIYSPLMRSSIDIMENNVFHPLQCIKNQEDGWKFCFWHCIIPSKFAPTCCCPPRIRNERKGLSIRDICYFIVKEHCPAISYHGYSALYFFDHSHRISHPSKDTAKYWMCKTWLAAKNCR
jgi:hypothetical protein